MTGGVIMVAGTAVGVAALGFGTGGTGSPSSSHRSDGSGPMSVGTIFVGAGWAFCLALGGGEETAVFCPWFMSGWAEVGLFWGGAMFGCGECSGTAVGCNLDGCVSAVFSAAGCGAAASSWLCRCTVGGCWAGLGCGRGRDGSSSSTEESVFWLGATFCSASPTVWARLDCGEEGGLSAITPESWACGSFVGAIGGGDGAAVSTSRGGSVWSGSAGSLVGEAAASIRCCTGLAGAFVVGLAFRWCS